MKWFAVTLVTLLSQFHESVGSLTHNLRECPREKSENLGIIANRIKKVKNGDDVYTKDKDEGLFIDPDYIKCNSQETDMCNRRGIKGEVKFRLRKNCIMRNKAKRYDFSVHVKIPEHRALPVNKKTTIKVHGLPENNTKAWMSPYGDEIIFNINDVSWRDLAIFLRHDPDEEINQDLIVRRGFSIAPLTQAKHGFKTQFFEELNFARNGSAEIIDDDESAFYICKQDHVKENIVTIAFWHQKIFTGLLMDGQPHSVTYKMTAVFGALFLFCIMLCLVSALLTLKKQADINKPDDEEEDEDAADKLIEE